MALEDTPEDLNDLLDIDLESLQNIQKEMVNHPDHYKSNGLEAIDIIEAFNLGFNIGNVIKYILRAGRKESYIQDLEKAQWYLQREILRVNNSE